jgi:chromosome segregation ATPase
MRLRVSPQPASVQRMTGSIGNVVGELEKANEQLAADLESARETATANERRVQALTEERERLNRELGGVAPLRVQIAELEEELGATKLRLSQTKDEGERAVKAAEAELQSVQQSIAVLRTAEQAAAFEIESLREQISAERASRQSASEHAQTCERERDQAMTRCTTLERQVRRLSEEVEDLENQAKRADELDAQLKDANLQIAQRDARLANTDSERLLLSGKIEESAAEQDRLRQELTQSQALLQDAQAEIVEARGHARSAWDDQREARLTLVKALKGSIALKEHMMQREEAWVGEAVELTSRLVDLARQSVVEEGRWLLTEFDGAVGRALAYRDSASA